MKGRTTRMLGCNLRPGVTPGGFSTPIGSTHYRPRPKRVGQDVIREAARTFMLARGVVTCSTDFDCRSEKRTVEMAGQVSAPIST